MPKRIPTPFIIITLAVALGLLGQLRIDERERAHKHWEPLEQISEAIRLYADDSRGERYPSKAVSRDSFIPELHMLRPYLARVGDEEALVAKLLSRECEKPLCYMGHMLIHEAAGLAMLRKYETEDPEKVRDLDHVLPDQEDRLPIYRLREGLERFIIYDIGNPAGAAQAQSKIPIMWELPRPDRPSEGLVLYMDGHIEAVEYPGPFPMSPRFVREARRMMGLRDGAAAPDEVTRSIANSPVGAEAEEILEVTMWWDLPFTPWCIIKCDTSANFRLGNCRAYEIRIDGGRKGHSQGSTHNGFSVYLAPLDCGTAANDERLSNIGESGSYRWFTDAPVLLQDEFRSSFGLKNGEDRYTLYQKACESQSGIAATEWSYRGNPTDVPKTYIFNDYKIEFVVRRESEGRPVPEELRQAHCILLKHIIRDYGGFRYPADMAEQAKQVITSNDDREAAVIIMLDLALTFGRGNAKITTPFKEISQHGLEMLQTIPKEMLRPILMDLKARLNVPDQIALLNEASEVLGLSASSGN